MRHKIISVVGARPQFIKHAPMSLALQRNFNSLSIHTGQHFDENMSQVFFDELKIPRPNYILDIEKASLHGMQTASMLQQIETVLIHEKPDAVLVYGDTNSTLAGALAASKLHMPVIHIEAGLRSFNREMPEEINRILTDHMSTLLFAPTPVAVENLRKENITKGVYYTGDVMCDTLNLVRPLVKRLYDDPYFFITLHRPYNTDEKKRLLSILEVINRLPQKSIFPIHPRTANNLKKWNVKIEEFENIHFIDPIGYTASLSYQCFSEAVITDSGGIQKEAYMLHKQCITVRKETEWVETLEDGCNTLVFDKLDQMHELLTEEKQFTFKDFYGNGHAAEEINSIIASELMLDSA